MKLKSLLAAAAALAALLGAGVAQARDNVYWSVGVDAAPGVSLGVGNVRPVVVAPQPVYVAPQPVYVAPAPVAVYRPAPVYRAAPVVYEAPVYYAPRHFHKHHRHHRHWD
jgi:hypothetical protein